LLAIQQEEYRGIKVKNGLRKPDKKCQKPGRVKYHGLRVKNTQKKPDKKCRKYTKIYHPELYPYEEEKVDTWSEKKYVCVCECMHVLYVRMICMCGMCV
jgi:hypothetical protein